MKLLHFYTPDSTLHLGVKTDKGIVDVTAATAEIPANLADLMAGGEAALAQLQTFVDQGNHPLLTETDLRLGPCVPAPGKILCVGLNYRRHAAESGMAVPTTPVLFSKFNNSLAAANEVIPLPSNAEQYDYEVELVVVIGKKARYVSQAEALDYVFGYCTGNDLSARDLQMLTGQWLLGKTLDKFMPIGPYLVTADEVGDPHNLALKCWCNGELRQNSNTSDLIFNVAEVVSYASQYMTLEPGDIISTGTPEGVILGMAEKNWLKPGDEVVVEVEKLGALHNTMGAENHV